MRSMSNEISNPLNQILSPRLFITLCFNHIKILCYQPSGALSSKTFAKIDDFTVPGLKSPPLTVLGMRLATRGSGFRCT